MNRGPPAWARRVLERSLNDRTFATGVLDDLDREFEEMAARTTSARARRWYTVEALDLAAHFMLKRLWENGRMGMIERVGRNLRLAVRRLVRAPAFSATAVTTMALGVGATVAIFSVVDAVLLRPLPYDRPEELVALFEWHLTTDNRTNVANPRNFRLWRERAERFDGITAVSLQFPATVEVAGEPREAMIQYLQPDFFEVLGLRADVGATFSARNAEGTEQVVLSQAYWRERFGADPSVVGSTIRVNGQPAVVSGVLPLAYMPFGEGTQLWRTLDLAQGETGRWMYPLGRVSPGVEIAAASDEIRAIMAGLREEFPDYNAGWDVNPVPLKQHVVGDASRGLWLLLGAVGVLLAIACANVANLFLVAATERQREMAVRTSLGASGSTLAGQLLTESVLVAGLGGGLGLLLAYAGTSSLAGRMPDAFALPRVEDAGVNGTVLLFSLVLVVGTGVLFGLVPALQAARTAPAATLAAEGRSTSRRTGLLRNGLVVGQVALSVALLSGAGLLGRSFTALISVDPGIDPQDVVVARVNLEGTGRRSGGEQTRFFQELTDRLSARPGVATAGAITFLPMGGGGSATGFWPTDRPVPPPDDEPTTGIRNVIGDYFGAMNIALLQGRVFDVRDRSDSPQVVVVNRALAEEFWPGESAVGKSVAITWEDDTPWEIVGVVEDVLVEALDQAAGPLTYVLYAQAEWFPWMQVAVRGSAGIDGLAATMRAALRDMDSALPLGEVRPMTAVVARTAARPRMTSFLMLLFAGLATLLAAIGLYGVLSYSVSQRVREIGVRIALGARPRDVAVMVAARGLALVLVGLVAGVGLALGGGRLMTSLLFSVAPTDPLSIGGAALLLLLVAAAATILPAARASRVPPAVALRAE